jgi:maltose alpha-D-glucosyltransferase/alpha-amylase
MFMAIRREEAKPIIETIERTPAIGENCQWGLFLRNHDELTLQMVTEDERDYMYAEYAKDPRARSNAGIARRLAPLIDNDRRVAELFHALLFTLPGSPILYYGDEILMGDNIYLGDRDAVRTPMQWSADRNGGFSRADFHALYLPPLMDSVYGFQAVNVEGSVRDPSSFLHWVRRMLHVRREHAVFGEGDFELVDVDNPAVLAFVRTLHQRGDAERATVLCVGNMSANAQPAHLDVSQWAPAEPIELTGGVAFPRFGAQPYRLTLPPYGFIWFQLDEPLPG